MSGPEETIKAIGLKAREANARRWDAIEKAVRAARDGDSEGEAYWMAQAATARAEVESALAGFAELLPRR